MYVYREVAEVYTASQKSSCTPSRIQMFAKRSGCIYDPKTNLMTFIIPVWQCHSPEWGPLGPTHSTTCTTLLTKPKWSFSYSDYPPCLFVEVQAVLRKPEGGIECTLHFYQKRSPPPPQFPHLSPVNYFQWTTESPQPYLLNLPSAHTHTHLPGYISAVQYDWNIIFNNGKRQKGFLGGPPRYEREEARVQS